MSELKQKNKKQTKKTFNVQVVPSQLFFLVANC